LAIFDQDKYLHENRINKLKRQVDDLKNENSRKINEIKKLRDKYILEKKDLIKERDTLNIQLKSHKSKDNQYQHEIKKKEKLITQLKDKLRYIMGDKENQYKNSLDMIQSCGSKYSHK